MLLALAFAMAFVQAAPVAQISTPRDLVERADTLGDWKDDDTFNW
jgi:hypothetical protein